MTITLDADAYRRDGYLPGAPIFTTAEARRMQAECARDCAVEQRPDERRQASNRVKPYLLFPWAAKLVRHPALLDAVEQLIGPDILVFHTTIWWKDAGTPNFVPWHQDGTYFGLAPFEHVTAWVALTPSTPESGCVRILPGSHTEGQLAHRDQADRRAMLSRGQTLARDLDETKAVDIVLAPGEVSFHHTLACHQSGPNRSTAPRVGIGVSYIPPHVRHIGDTRLSAMLARGEDRFGNFDLETAPRANADAAAVAAHADALGRFWRASESIPEMAHVH